MTFVLLALALAPPVSVFAGGPDADRKLKEPFAVAFAPDGTAYVVEMAKGERVRRIDPDGRAVTVAGVGTKGDAGDGGPAVKASFNGIHSAVCGPDGRLYLADTWNNRVRVFDPVTGHVSAFAGTSEKGYAGDGGSPRKARRQLDDHPLVPAKFAGVFCLAFDKGGKNLYVADLDNRRVRKIDVDRRTISCIAGNGEKGVPTDGEPADKQPLTDPRAVAVDDAGTVYILERGGHALRAVGADGAIRTVAGTGKAGSGGLGGPALKAGLNGPKHLCIDRDGSVLIADAENHRVVRYDPKAGTLTGVLGSGTAGDTLDADPLKVQLRRPHGVTVHPKTGALYVVDSYNDRVLKLER